jgi:hypothetical protein
LCFPVRTGLPPNNDEIACEMNKPRAQPAYAVRPLRARDYGDFSAWICSALAAAELYRWAASRSPASFLPLRRSLSHIGATIVAPIS